MHDQPALGVEQAQALCHIVQRCLEAGTLPGECQQGRVEHTQRQQAHRQPRDQTQNAADRRHEARADGQRPQTGLGLQPSDGLAADHDRHAHALERRCEDARLLQDHIAGGINDAFPHRLAVARRKLEEPGKPHVLVLPQPLVGVDELGHLAGAQPRFEGEHIAGGGVADREGSNRNGDRDGQGNEYANATDQFADLRDAHRHGYSTLGRLWASRSALTPSSLRRNWMKREAAALG